MIRRRPARPARPAGTRRTGPRWAPIEIPIDSPARWSVRVGCVRGMELRLHALLVIWAALVLVRVFAGVLQDDPGPRGPVLLLIGGTAVLFAGLLHEVGRLAVAARLHALPLSMSLWPLGGLEDLPSHAEWRTRVRTAAGGFGALLVAGLLVGAALFLVTGTFRDVAIPSPVGELELGVLQRRDGTQPVWLVILHELQRGLLTVLALHLVPMAPLAGGRLLEAILMAARGRAAARRLAVQVWLLAACILLLAALVLGGWLGVLAAAVGGTGAAALLVRESSGDPDAAIDPDRRTMGGGGGADEAGNDDPVAELLRDVDDDLATDRLDQGRDGGPGGRADADADEEGDVVPDADAAGETDPGRTADGPRRSSGQTRDRSGVRSPGESPGGGGEDDAGEAEPPLEAGASDAAKQPARMPPRMGPSGPSGPRERAFNRPLDRPPNRPSDGPPDEVALDAVLAKIAREGMSSLDPDDHEVLARETARRNEGDAAGRKDR